MAAAYLNNLLIELGFSEALLPPPQCIALGDIKQEDG